MEKKIDPARATAMAASEAVEAACTRAKRMKGVTTKPSAPTCLTGFRRGRQPLSPVTDPTLEARRWR
ncbi:MAG: hypothetical protein D6683_06405 [Actinomyces sp.]|nr:MAG: hypothetical protein D6683_06405 [Actinomyces sp.]